MRIRFTTPFAVSAALSRARCRWLRAPVRRTTAALASPTNGPDEVASVTSHVHIAKTPQPFEYDLDGNQTLVATKTGTWRVTYNGENRPVRWERLNSSTSNSNTPSHISMSYDRMGRRVTKNNQRFVYDGYLQIANFELQTSNNKLALQA